MNTGFTSWGTNQGVQLLDRMEDTLELWSSGAVLFYILSSHKLLFLPLSQHLVVLLFWIWAILVCEW